MIDRYALGILAMLTGAVPGQSSAPKPAAAPSADWEDRLAAFAKTARHVRRDSYVLDWRGRRYRIYLSLPAGTPPPAGFPIVVVTDGNGLFPIAGQIAENEAFFGDYSKVEPAVVVGIGYDTDLPFPPIRHYDLTLPVGDATAANDRRSASEGGADHLLDMIEQRVKPDVARRIAIDGRRQTLVGHSLGGLFVLHALFTRPQAFQTYVASSPSIWWHDRRLLADLPAFERRMRRGEIAARLLLSVGGLEVPPKGTGKADDTIDMVGDARAMHVRLRALQTRRFPVRFREYVGQDHLTVVPTALAAGVRFALRQDS